MKLKAIIKGNNNKAFQKTKNAREMSKPKRSAHGKSIVVFPQSIKPKGSKLYGYTRE